MVIDLFEESPSFHIVTDLSKLETDCIGTITSLPENVVRVDDDIGQGLASFSTLSDKKRISV